VGEFLTTNKPTLYIEESDKLIINKKEVFYNLFFIFIIGAIIELYFKIIL